MTKLITQSEHEFNQIDRVVIEHQAYCIIDGDDTFLYYSTWGN